MELIETPIQDLLIIKPKVFEDERGFFCETYNELRYKKAGILQTFIQDNQSKSSYGVIRGLHYQLAPYSQSKLVSVTAGKVFDVAVDLRKKSATYGQWFGVELSEENHLQFFIPKGFAHGFSVLSPSTIFNYKCDEFYHPESERGLLYNDPHLSIDWKIELEKMIVSEKDKKNAPFQTAEMNF